MTNARDKRGTELRSRREIDKITSSREHCKKSANQQKRKKAQRIVFLSVVSTILTAIVVGAPLIFIFSGDQGPATTEASWFTRYYHSYSEMESSYEKLYSDYCKSTGKGEETIPEFFRLNYEECLSSKTGTMTHYISGISNSSQKKVNERILTPYEAGFEAPFGPKIFDVHGREMNVNQFICVNYFKKKKDISTPSLVWNDPSSFSNEEGDSVYENFGPNSLWPRGGIAGWSTDILYYLVDLETNQAIISISYPSLRYQYGGDASEKSLSEFEAAISDIMEFLKEQTFFLLSKEQNQ